MYQGSFDNQLVLNTEDTPVEMYDGTVTLIHVSTTGCLEKKEKALRKILLFVNNYRYKLQSRRYIKSCHLTEAQQQEKILRMSDKR